MRWWPRMLSAKRDLRSVPDMSSARQPEGQSMILGFFIVKILKIYNSENQTKNNRHTQYMTVIFLKKKKEVIC